MNINDKILTNVTLTNTTNFSRVDQIFSGWRDLRAFVTALPSGSTAPSLASFGPSGIVQMYAFNLNDLTYLALHVDHDIKLGSTCYLHVHWSTSGTSTNSVVWEINYTIASGHNQSNYGINTTITLTGIPHGTAWRHMITEDSVGFPAPEPDSLILMRLRRISNGGSNNTNSVFGLFVDLHHEIQLPATPNRTPPFF